MCLHPITDGGILKQTLKMGPKFLMALYSYLCSLSCHPIIELSIALFIMYVKCSIFLQKEERYTLKYVFSILIIKTYIQFLKIVMGDTKFFVLTSF